MHKKTFTTWEVTWRAIHSLIPIGHSVTVGAMTSSFVRQLPVHLIFVVIIAKSLNIFVFESPPPPPIRLSFMCIVHGNFQNDMGLFIWIRTSLVVAQMKTHIFISRVYGRKQSCLRDCIKSSGIALIKRTKRE